MYPSSLKVQNFCSFENASYEFEDGLVLVEGVNGSGKSCFFSDLLCWILFDCTPRGIRFDDVIRKGAPQVSAELILDAPPSIITRTRVRGKGSVVLVNGNRITQLELEDLLGIDYTTFTASVVHAQMFQGFAERSESEQKTILTKLMNLEMYDECKKVVDARLTKITNNISHLDTIREMIKEQLDSILKKDYVALEKEFEQKKQKELKLISEKIGELEEKVKERISTEDVKAELGKLLLEYDAVKVKDLTADLEEANFQVNARMGELKSLDTSLTGLLQEVEDVKQMKGPCPTCGQEITEESVTTCVQTIEVEIKRVRENINDLLREIAKREQFRDDLRAVQTKVTEAREKKLQEIEKLQEKLQNLSTREHMIQVYKGMLDDKRMEQERVKAWENPYTKLSLESNREIQSLTDRLKESDTKELNDTKRYYEFWSEGFSNRGIKSFIFDSLIPEFTMRTNKYLSLLTEKDITVLFDTQREKKTGGLSERFTIKIADDVGERPFQAWSGGERKRISTAIDLSLSDMCAMRTRNTWDFIVLDEVLDGLDSAGVEMLVYLMEDIIKEKKMVYIISHNDSISSMIDKRVLVTKEEGISCLKTLKKYPQVNSMTTAHIR